MYKGKGYLFVVFSVMMLLSFGCVKKTVPNNNPASYINEDKAVVEKSNEIKATVDTTVTPTVADIKDPVVQVDQKTMGDLKAGFKYIKASYTAILAGIDKIKNYDIGKYNTIIDKIYPLMVQLGEVIDTYSDALNNMDDNKALTAYNIGRPLITTILKVGGPILISMIF